MTATDRTSTTDVSAPARQPGIDVTRAVALVGVVLMNYIGYLVFRGAPVGHDVIDRLLDPWDGPLATRFAATFTLVAGVGVTLFTRRAVGDRAATSARRWALVRRGLVLSGGGLLLDMVWPGTILVYYGAMFVVGAVVCTWRTRGVVAVGVVAALAGAAIAWWGLERRLDGHDTGWLFSPGPGSPRGVALDLFVNGTHPLLPWLAFFCTGIVVGRTIDRPAWRSRAIVIGVGLFAVATGMGTLLGDGARAGLASTDPFSRSLVYTASALGTALVALGVITWLVDRHADARVVRVLADAGAMSLTLYLAHAFVFLLLVDRLEWVRPTGLDTAVVLSAGFWIAAVLAAATWHRRVGIGPAEWLYRRLGVEAVP